MGELVSVCPYVTLAGEMRADIYHATIVNRTYSNINIYSTKYKSV